MIIPENILFKHGAKIKHFKSDDLIFKEGDYARYYFQIGSGLVKLNNVFEDGKEFVHGFPFEGHCFGTLSVRLQFQTATLSSWKKNHTKTLSEYILTI